MSDVTTICEGQHLCLRRRGTWEYAERRKISGVVVIVPQTDAGEFLFVEQMRAPVGCPVIEFPAGLAGDVAGFETEELLSAARRELLEETGYEASEWRLLPACPSSAGLTSEVVTFFRATGLKKVSEKLGDGSEQITLHAVPARNVDTWLAKKMQEGKLIAVQVYAGLYLFSTD